MVKRTIYIVYSVIVVALVVLCVLGIVPLWAAALPILLPIVWALLTTLVMFITADIGEYLKRKNAPTPSCGNCAFGAMKVFDEKNECMGEKSGHKYGKLCPFYHPGSRKKSEI